METPRFTVGSKALSKGEHDEGVDSSLVVVLLGGNAILVCCLRLKKNSTWTTGVSRQVSWIERVRMPID